MFDARDGGVLAPDVPLSLDDGVRYERPDLSFAPDGTTGLVGRVSWESKDSPGVGDVAVRRVRVR